MAELLGPLAAAGAFDALEANRARVFAAVDFMLSSAQRTHEAQATGQSELFGGASARPGALGATLRLLRYPYAVVRDLSRGEINLRAMGLVYTTLLSLIPLLAFSFAILKIFGGHRDLQPIVYEFFRPVGDAAAAELTSRVMQFANRVSSGVVGSVGLALLAWTLVGTIKKVEDSFNFVWHVDHPRSFARRLAEYTSLLIAGPVLLVGFLAVDAAGGGGSGSPTTVKVLPAYSSNPYTGRMTVKGGAYNPYTGANRSYKNTYNPMTGRQTHSSSAYNPLTGNATNRHSSYNPMTGTGRRATTRHR